MKPSLTIPFPRRFPKSCRVRKNRQFRSIQNKGRRVFARYMTAVCLTNQANDNRIGLTVSKKVGNAVNRNKVKRRLRELWRISPPTPLGLDIVILARPGLAQIPFSDFKKDWLLLMTKIQKLFPA